MRILQLCIILWIAVSLTAGLAVADDAAVDRAIGRWDRACAGATELGACTRTRVVAVAHACSPIELAIEIAGGAAKVTSVTGRPPAALEACLRKVIAAVHLPRSPAVAARMPLTFR